MRCRPRRYQAAAVLLTVAVALILPGCGLLSPNDGGPARSSPPALATPSQPPTREPARLVDARQVDRRTVDLTVASPALGSRAKVRLLLPTRYRSSPDRSWPSLYLLHGCCDSYLSWTRSTDIEQFTAEEDLAVVMPDGGRAGFYTDWRTGPGWETFHTVELPQLLATRYRLTGPRAVAGVSMGGLGALDYAARHRGQFAAAASFSGIVHTRLSGQESQNYLGLLQSQGEEPLNLWGDPQQNADVWAEHNPYDLAERLRGTSLYLSCGNGRPGALDDPDAGPDEIESALEPENRALAKRLADLDIPAQVNLYGAGTHNWVYWQRELHTAWPLLTARLYSR